ncbi:putative fatty acyl-CoA reductase CG5065 isoform X2 [Leptidea sinapis]|nr:putative fatty acyl-CoA reductase CG5065 isoform X2 [Leptidea sinapis]
MRYETVSDRYAGKCVFITGGTGFLGKVLLEKLLYACPDIDRIFLLLRNKKNLSAAERLKNMLELPLYTRLKKEKPSYLNKIVPVIGDICLPQLGLSTKEEKLLIDSVSFVFHSAATVNFNDELRKTYNINVKGTERVLVLCKQMKKLEALVHVSSTYANTHQEIIEEVLYPPPAPTWKVNDILCEDSFDVEEVQSLLDNYPNTYTFTKSLAENIVVEKHGGVPVVIVRPSIVSASIEEIPGWVDNWNGASALMAALAKGLNRSILGHSSIVLDLIPVDYVTNLLIVAGARCQLNSETLIYNSCSSSENPLKISKFANLVMEDSVKHGFNDIPCPNLIFTQSKLILWVLTVLLQTIPAYIADIILKLFGKEARYIKIQAKTLVVRNALEYFTSHSWRFRSKHTQELYAALSDMDRKKFPFSAASIEWEKYIPTYCAGIRKYLFNLNVDYIS